MPPSPPLRWLLLIHQIPPRPAYLRVKAGRRLQGLGAVAVKNSVYVLPRGDQAREDFQWLREEIVAGGGEAFVCEARFVEGLTDDALEALFNAARAADYEELVQEARRLQGGAKGARRRGSPEQVAAALARLRKRLAGVAALDFFAARGRDTVEGLLAAAESALRPAPAAGPARAPAVRGRTWTTRAGVQIDRMASAWLIRRFIDPRARFRFVRGPDEAGPRDLRFDMLRADFTHEGDRCTFEVLLRRFVPDDPALARIAGIVHDVDLGDARFGHPETAGLEQLVTGIALRHQDDQTRLRESAAVFDALYESLTRRRP